MTDLTAHFSWDEVTASPTAEARGIDNTLPANLRANVEQVAALMEQVRDLLGGHPLKVNSWYRSPILNAAIGGSPRSRHMDGLAVDFDVTVGTNDKAFATIAASAIQYDQLIHERTKSGADWIHFGSAITPPRRQVLAAAGDTLGGPMTFRRVALG